MPFRRGKLTGQSQAERLPCTVSKCLRGCRTARRLIRTTCTTHGSHPRTAGGKVWNEFASWARVIPSGNAMVTRREQNSYSTCAQLCKAATHALGVGFREVSFVIAIRSRNDLRKVFLTTQVVHPHKLELPSANAPVRLRLAMSIGDWWEWGRARMVRSVRQLLSCIHREKSQ